MVQCFNHKVHKCRNQTFLNSAQTSTFEISLGSLGDRRKSNSAFVNASHTMSSNDVLFFFASFCFSCTQSVNLLKVIFICAWNALNQVAAHTLETPLAKPKSTIALYTCFLRHTCFLSMPASFIQCLGLLEINAASGGFPLRPTENSCQTSIASVTGCKEAFSDEIGAFSCLVLCA